MADNPIRRTGHFQVIVIYQGGSSMIRGVIFDMDGVLIDTENFYMAQREEFLKAYGISQGDGTRFFGAMEEDVWKALVPDDEVLQVKLQRYYREYQREHPTPYASLLNGQVRDVFSKLKAMGLMTAIASSSCSRDIQTVMEAAGISELVDYYISGECCQAPKPAPEIYLRAMEALGLDSSSAIAVEDSPIGIEAALGAGMKVYALVPSQGRIDQGRATGRLKELHDIFKHV